MYETYVTYKTVKYRFLENSSSGANKAIQASKKIITWSYS